jgi:hypothetical protein
MKHKCGDARVSIRFSKRPEKQGEDTVHSTQYTVHSTQYTVHSTQYTVHSTQYTVHSTQYTVQVPAECICIGHGPRGLRVQQLNNSTCSSHQDERC